MQKAQKQKNPKKKNKKNHFFWIFLLTQYSILHRIDTSFGGIVQLVEHRTHIPYVIGSSPIAPTYYEPTLFDSVGSFFIRYISFGLEPTVQAAQA